MLPSKHAYLTGAGGVLASRGISLVAGILSLWFLNQLLTTEDFAAYAVAMTVIILAGYTSGLGMERALILRIAGLEQHKGKLLGRTMMVRTLLVVLVLSCLSAIALVLVAQHAEMAAAATTWRWIEKLAPAVPATAAGLVLTSWFQANHRIGTSELMQGLNDGARCLFFLAALTLGLGSGAVIAGAIAAAVLPSLTLSLLAKGRSLGPPEHFGIRNIWAGAQFLAMRLSQMGLRQLDIISIGFLGSGTETAHYVVASRVAAFATLGQETFASTYGPRARRHLAAGDMVTMAQEYHSARVFGFLAALLAALLFIVFGASVLRMFGDFEGGYPALLILVAGHLVNTSFGEQIIHMSMTGDLRLSVVNRLASVLLFAALLLVLVPDHGVIGASLSFFIAITASSTAGAMVLRARGGPPALKPLFAVAASLSSACLIAAALNDDHWIYSAAGLAVSLMLVAAAERRLLRVTIRKALSLKY